jgi:hypothetical protein
MLQVLHFADRARLFKLCYDLLRPGGLFFAADFFELGKLDHVEWKVSQACFWQPGVLIFMMCNDADASRRGQLSVPGTVH